MNAVVGYESMYGNTRLIAEAIARGASAGLGDNAVSVRHVGEIDGTRLGELDLLVLGGPTHTWSMSRPTTRKGAAQSAAKPGSGLTMEPSATQAGVREWLAALPETEARPRVAAAFDTRMHAPLGLSGAAARTIERRLRRRGIRCAVPAKGFFVTKQNVLEPDEAARAEAWGKELAALVAGLSGSTSL
jgi:hypothetical protein